MIWQDIVLTGVSIVFSIALIPQIYHGFKAKTGSINFMTSGPTFIGLYINAVTYFTLSLFYSSFMALIAGTLWLILFIQRIIYSKQPKT